MFIGHYAPAFIAAAYIPGKSDADSGRKTMGLGTLFIAAQLVDIAFFLFVLAGVEHLRIVPDITAMNDLDLYHMPYTHSLLGTMAWALGFAGMIWMITKNRMATALVAVVVASHWFIDLLVHRPDLSLTGSLPKLGYGLWDRPVIAIGLELMLTVASIGFYIRKTAAKRNKMTHAKLALTALIMLLASAQAINWFGPAPLEYSAELPITGLLAYGVLAIPATWLGMTRITMTRKKIGGKKP